MVSTRGKGSCGTREGMVVENVLNTHCKRMDHTQENCYSLHDFPNKTTNISKSEGFEAKSFSKE